MYLPECETVAEREFVVTLGVPRAIIVLAFAEKPTLA
jgi:hypothetical protein